MDRRAREHPSCARHRLPVSAECVTISRAGSAAVSLDPLVVAMKKRKRQKRDAELIAEEIFRRRAERLQSECGWCGESIGEDEPVFGIGGKALPGIDLSLVQGKVVEIVLESAGK